MCILRSVTGPKQNREDSKDWGSLTFGLKLLETRNLCFLFQFTQAKVFKFLILITVLIVSRYCIVTKAYCLSPNMSLIYLYYTAFNNFSITILNIYL